ncbi:DUF2795 domain-containing protein [Streptomyces sp. NPDC052040]|uniref:DUF2795 domain-containing protein n=1 Tax=unclassified Streptomyces TaxID=2593676 RepID=UPI0037D4D2B4
MQRGSDRLSVYRDDEMKHELQGLLRSGHPTRTEEWHDPEPSADDDPAVWAGASAPGGSVADVRFEFARILGRTAFPGHRDDLVEALRRKHAPDTLVDTVARLPRSARYANAQELARAVVEP